MARARGFTLLEVMVAVAILGLGLTAILSAQAGSFNAARHARNISVATGLARCKMNEVEEQLLKLGYQEMDQADSGPCCEGDTTPNVRCTWKIEKLVLPEPQYGKLDLGGALSPGAMNGPPGGAASPGGGMMGGLGGLLGGMPGGAQGGNPLGSMGGALGGLGMLAQQSQQPEGSMPLFAPDAGVAGMAQQLSGSSNATVSTAASMGFGGALQMLMGMVYPQLKRVFEVGSRRITVTLTWSEGKKEHSIEVVQWVTDGRQAGLVGDIPGMDGASPAASGSAAPPSPGGPSGPLSPLTNPVTGGSTR
jgi:general secretion pathway protein I